MNRQVASNAVGGAVRHNTTIAALALLPVLLGAAAPEPEAPKDPMAEFKNDALIRKALELFRADIQSA